MRYGLAIIMGMNIEQLNNFYVDLMCIAAYQRVAAQLNWSQQSVKVIMWIKLQSIKHAMQKMSLSTLKSGNNSCKSRHF